MLEVILTILLLIYVFGVIVLLDHYFDRRRKIRSIVAVLLWPVYVAKVLCEMSLRP